MSNDVIQKMIGIRIMAVAACLMAFYIMSKVTVYADGEEVSTYSPAETAWLMFLAVVIVTVAIGTIAGEFDRFLVKGGDAYD